jgi:hypothetical protein
MQVRLALEGNFGGRTPIGHYMSLTSVESFANINFMTSEFEFGAAKMMVARTTIEGTSAAQPDGTELGATFGSGASSRASIRELTVTTQFCMNSGMHWGSNTVTLRNMAMMSC